MFETAITATALIRPYLGRALLGWQPRKAGVIDNLEVYYKAWKATDSSSSPPVLDPEQALTSYKVPRERAI